MGVELQELAGGKVIQVDLTGKLVKADYDRFLPEFERRIAEHSKIRVLCTMHDFQGWSAGAAWEDLKFDVKHFRDIDRLAIVGHSSLGKLMTLFSKPFTAADMKYFDTAEADQARAWITEGLTD
ncbi:MAG: STAS/SEC14 domain-containing protein [Planctomycetota bacterium]|nr:MAG: STAS/SEC14 domain-containing protein [Planctomycetota bacterium]